MKTGLKLLAVSAVVVIVATSSAFAQHRGVTAEDYFSFKFLNDIRFSPDGSTIAFVIGTVDRKQNRRYSAIWTVAADESGKPSMLTTSTYSSTSPRWSPDGRFIAFLSARPMPGDALQGASKAQVWILSVNGSEPRRVTNFRNGVTVFAWSPDSTRLVCVSSSGPSDKAKSPSDVRHYKHANYKSNETGWFDDKRTHLWVVDVATGAAKQLTSGDDWNDRDPQWSPDGTKIAFVSDRTGKEFDEGSNSDVWVMDAAGGSLTKVSQSDEPDSQPRWSPDGGTIVFLGESEQQAFPQIWLASSAGGSTPYWAAENLDLIPTQLRWAEGGKALYFDAGVKGATHLFRVGLEQHRTTQVTAGERTVRLVDINDRTRRIAYAADDPTHPDDLYVADLDGRNEHQLTHLNADLFKSLQLSPVERLTFKGADGWDVDGFLIKPVGWEPGKKYPMILSIHGGPDNMYGFDWAQSHEFQVYAAHGWAVFFTNPRGSTGYGEKFDLGVQRHWGDRPYTDIMNGVDAVLAKNPWIDKERLGVTGGSYGGFMTNWIISHTTRFKAAVTLRSISNFISDDGTRDGQYGHAEDFGGDIFERFDAYWNTSPLKYAKNVKTPTLILHSDMDFRVPIEQGEQWFRALQHFGVPSEIVFFPRENHSLTRTGEPLHLVESLNWRVYWFERYLNGNEAAIPPDAPRPARASN